MQLVRVCGFANVESGVEDSSSVALWGGARLQAQRVIEDTPEGSEVGGEELREVS